MENFNLSELFVSTLSPAQVLLTIAIAFAVGLFIFFIYKRTFGGVMYSRNYNVSLMLLTLVTSFVLMLINNNLTLSLGMVGALSIIRFRTAVKDPIDTVFMFWAVGEGIAIGIKFYVVAIIAAVGIGIILVIMSVLKVKSSMPYLLIIHYHEAASQQVKQLVKQLPGARLKSKTAQRDGLEMTLELRLKDSETGFVEKLLKVDGVYDASLISYQGDIVA
ncbi:MAG TPA: DUF4956 domain-containing protein [Clostridia bacterium]|jgi:uncharacterized membrane protein YhiD involved in acid resistance|nr:DUF4956 domain-containing protein [Clostridia bacterium]